MVVACIRATVAHIARKPNRRKTRSKPYMAELRPLTKDPGALLRDEATSWAGRRIGLLLSLRWIAVIESDPLCKMILLTVSVVRGVNVNKFSARSELTMIRGNVLEPDRAIDLSCGFLGEDKQ